jgi:1-deoxy-D-xylulose-5-phosphate synthase
VRDEVWKALGKLSHFGSSAQEIVSKIEGSLKGSLLKSSNLFEALHLRYFGPVDGHDVHHLAHIMKDMANIPGPKILHILTVKGKGYALAEQDQTKWHAPGKFDKVTGEIYKKIYATPQPPKYQDVFGHTLVEIAKADERVVGITPAMPSGSSMNIMMKELPDRAFDVGIAEQHAVTFSAGLATQGMIPFCNIYSTFMQRAYDQVVHDVCLQNLPVVFCLDRAGFAGADGPTHHGAYDLAFFRCIPNLVLASPMNEQELRNLMYTTYLRAKRNEGPSSIRYPRGEGVMPNWRSPLMELEVGKGRKLQDGQGVAILTLGPIGNYIPEATALLERSGIRPAHFDMRWCKPLDESLLHEIFSTYNQIITVEDGCIQGGFGSAVLEFMADHGYAVPVRRLGIPDRVIEHGEQLELHHECGFDPEGIAKAVLEMNVLKKTVGVVL